MKNMSHIGSQRLSPSYIFSSSFSSHKFLFIVDKIGIKGPASYFILSYIELEKSVNNGKICILLVLKNNHFP